MPGRRRRARLARPLPRRGRGRPGSPRRARSTPARGGPLFLTARGRRLGRQQAWRGRQARGATRPGLGDRVTPAHAAPLVRDAPARGRRRPADRPGVARACEYLHDPALHPPDGRADPRGLRPGPSAGLREDHEPMASYAESLLASGRADRCAERASTGSSSSPTRGWAILALVVAVVLIVAPRAELDGSTAGSANILGWVVARGLVRRSASLSFGWQHPRAGRTRSIVITNRRVIQRRGRDQQDARPTRSLEKINDAVLTESLFGRMFGFGDLEILTASESGIERLRMLRDAQGLQEGDARGRSTSSSSSVAAAAPMPRGSAAAPAPRPRRRRPPRCRAAGARRRERAAAADVGRRGRRRRSAGLGRAARPGRDHARGVRGQEGGAARPHLSVARSRRRPVRYAATPRPAPRPRGPDSTRPAGRSSIAIILLVAFPVHEFAHAWVAYRLGDATAKLFGRLTLNPIVHFDPIGGPADRRVDAVSAGS